MTQQAPRDANQVPSLLLKDDVTGETVAALADSDGNILIAASISGTIPVSGGGTGKTSFTAYSVICGGTTSTGALQNVSGVGTSGQVLTSNGASALPTWQDPASAGANTALSNLASVAINAVLIPGTAGALDFGSAVKPWADVYFAGTSATPGTNNFKITGASTSGTRVITAPDASGTMTLLGNSSTGSGDVVLATSPTLTTPNIGVASGTSLALTSALTLEETGAGTDTITLQAPASIAASYTLTLPVDDGTANQVLATDGNGVLSWATPGSGTVTAVSVASANGFAGSSSGGATPALTLSTTITGILSGNGTAISAASTTGSGNVVLATSPSLTTPTLGVASATSINKVAITAPATSATLTIADGKTLTVSKTMSFTAADDTGTYTLPTGTKTLVATDVTTLSSLASVGTITTGVWNGTDVAVADGGTGLSSTTAYAVLCGGTTSTAALQSIASVGTAGQVLTSNGAGALPTFQNAAGGGTARRNLNIIMDVARLITRGTAPTNEASSQMIDCTITTSNAQSTKALSLGNNSEVYDWYDKDPEINISCIYSAGSTTGSGKWFFGDTGGDQNPTNTITTKSMFVYVRTDTGTSTVYAVNASGTANTNTLLSSVTLNSTMLWRVVKNSTTNIKYYYNYTLKATHTTNLPSGDFNDGDTHYFSVRNDNGDTTTRTGTFGLCDLLINSPTT